MTTQILECGFVAGGEKSLKQRMDGMDERGLGHLPPREIFPGLFSPQRKMLRTLLK